MEQMYVSETVTMIDIPDAVFEILKETQVTQTDQSFDMSVNLSD